FRSRPLHGLLQRVHGEQAEADGYARIQGDAIQTRGRLGTYVVKVGGGAPDDASEGHDEIVAAALGTPLGGQGQLKRAGNPHDVDVRGVQTVLNQRLLSTAQEGAGEKVVKSGDDEGGFHTPAIQPPFPYGGRPRPVVTVGRRQ